jgi:hypothetical protein
MSYASWRGDVQISCDVTRSFSSGPECVSVARSTLRSPALNSSVDIASVSFIARGRSQCHRITGWKGHLKGRIDGCLAGDGPIVSILLEDLVRA